MSSPSRLLNWLRRPLGRVPTLVLALAIVLAPGWLYRESLRYYRLFSDDFAYIAASRTLDRAVDNLFVPHNTHIVPAWRLLTWAVVAGAGHLGNLQSVLPVVSYGTLVLAMLTLGHLVAHETGRMAAGLAAMTVLGVNTLLRSSATWYSAGQALWAGLGVLGMLVFLQGWRQSGGTARLILGTMAAAVAGWFWTVGYTAGPVGAVYLWADGRSRCRRAAVLPLLASLLAAGLALGLGAGKIDATVSFHGRTSKDAADPVLGASHTLQAIPENLVLGSLGLRAETTIAQGLVLTVALAAAWAFSGGGIEGGESRGSMRRLASVSVGLGVAVVAVVVPLLRPRPDWTPAALAAWVAFLGLAALVAASRHGLLERAGATLVLVSYLVEWCFRGYLPFSSLRGIVPWYDTIPLIGAVLFAAGWWSRLHSPRPGDALRPLTRAGGLGLLVLLAAMVTLHRPRADAELIASVPEMSDREAAIFVIPELQRSRAVYLAEEHARWQHRHLIRLDQAEAIARRDRIGLDGIARTFGRLEAPEIPEAYDAAPMMALPADGAQDDPAAIRRALGPAFIPEPEPVLPEELLQSIARPRPRGPGDRDGDSGGPG